MARTASYATKTGVAVSVNFDSLLNKIKKAGGDIEAATYITTILLMNVKGRACPII